MTWSLPLGKDLRVNCRSGRTAGPDSTSPDLQWSAWHPDAARCCVVEQPFPEPTSSASVLDPMLEEAQLPWEAARAPLVRLGVPLDHGLSSFTFPGPTLESPVLGLQVGQLAVPTSPSAFAQALGKPLDSPVLPLPPPLRRPRRKTLPAAPPRRSNRLAKKAMRRLPSVTTAQNLLIRKMGLAADDELEPSDFDRYAQIYKDGLTEEQTRLIRELFSHLGPSSVQEADTEGGAEGEMLGLSEFLGNSAVDQHSGIELYERKDLDSTRMCKTFIACILQTKACECD
ncbi:hypothetical protein BAE44_0009977 [Dichanthelium oligosanthes]|uniref:Uncharacterized protein n=1 Tax=Dichanthelium oligosanthes TaxID=888268 RepID=A0A1E5VVA5_9POAL|nr:hypothetical protein BAE44_0009977 [Dichanthelium oligosanthes]